ncbi:cyclin-like protein [Fistulina hepatica ATCC 64428]|uniref:B-related factor 1 n=1 Tax=Fistulina hepatica ATCC 64428 TaxID=1128425 RepID=A0A0D7AG49_9AGAR|nr:cyclin-like protein [Fistulina hepatica ATCC 64428]
MVRLTYFRRVDKLHIYRLRKPSCSECGGSVIEYDTAAGNGFCTSCGTVVEENTIVSEVTFGETSSGAAMVQGAFFVAHARMSGPYGNRSNTESREQTIARATENIRKIAMVLHISETVMLAAVRMYKLAVDHRFTKGRKSLNVAAVCLYVACRQKETRNYMLIDFSDILEVNVFELGHIYLQLVQTLELRLPLVDPSHYISRFAALLEFGDDTHRVANDAVRLVQRFDRDWMTRGRRPAGICGAALLLAARMNNFRRSVEEIVQVVKIADVTLKKRLDEFKNTPSGSLTLSDFRSVWLDEEMDPPAFTKGKRKEEAAKRAALGNEEDPESNKKKRKGKKGKGKRKKGEQNPALYGQGIDHSVDEVIAEEIAGVLSNAQGSLLNMELDEQERRRLAEIAERQAMDDNDELLGLDDEELDRLILSEEEVKIKERVWVEINREYLEALAGECLLILFQPRDASTAHGRTTADSVKTLLQENARFSRRINYDALKGLFGDDSNNAQDDFKGTPTLDNQDELYTLDDKSDGEGMVVVEEAGGAVSSKPAAPDDDKDEGADSDEDEDHKTDMYPSWEEAYQQEL